MFPEFALVVFPIPLDKSFCYRIPRDLLSRIRRGMRVIAPLGRRHEEGYVVDLIEEPNYPEDQIKEILDCLDDDPFFNEEMLMLTRWIADAYLSSWGEALKAAAPSGVRAMTSRMVEINPRADLNQIDMNSLSRSAPKQHAILNRIMRNRKITVRSLRNSLGSSGFYASLAALEKKGIIRISPAISKPVGKYVATARLKLSRDEAQEQLETMRKQAPKAALALQALIKMGSLPVRELMEKAGVSRSSIQTLEKRGLVEIEFVEEIRRPDEAWEDDSYPNMIDLTPEQRSSLAQISASVREGVHQVFLLHGVTGSGKTEVYMRAIELAIEHGKGAILLVPEISLTPQTVARFTGRFGRRIAVLHSRLSPGERYDQWRQIKSGEMDIAIGPRSAIFAPIEKVGLIVIDEEHETSYKQSEPAPRYHAREVAIKRGELAGAPVVLGTATPSIESYYRATTGEYILLEMPKRVRDIELPPIEVIDMREELVSKGNRSIFSFRLRHEIGRALKDRHQVMLFLNRRGFSTYVFCRECGYVERCGNCSVSLTYHQDRNILICHHCGLEKMPPGGCPKCKSRYIKHLGIGTQQVEAEVRKFFPSARVARMDSDSVSAKGAHAEILGAFRRGETDIIIGTQMIAKGLDFPNVTLVGVVNADVALNLPDFRASERAFNLLTQVAGRSGRGDKGGKVIIQTYMPEHYSIDAAKDHDYLTFYRQEILAREAIQYPPFSVAASVLVRNEDENIVAQAANELANVMRTLIDERFTGVDLRGPASAPLSKVKGKYRWHILVKSYDRKTLVNFLSCAIELADQRVTGGSDVIVDVDPISVL